MSQPPQPAPRQFSGVMVSSTFTDLKAHRLALIDVIDRQALKPLAMEQDSARADGDVIDSSLQKVRDAAAYIGVISGKYGQVPLCPRRNPDNLSITELEFAEALRLGRPILIFVMHKTHQRGEDDFELDADKRAKLNAFRERARQSRIYAEFTSPEDFCLKATQSVAELRRHLEDAAPVAQPAAAASPLPTTPRPPELCAEPPYIGSHQFVGRRAQLDELNDWAAAAEQHPVLLYEAIGGSGKSMLTWHWLGSAGRVPGVRADWAGRFWYSFYERGAVMADFCRRALAYMTGQPLHELNKLRTPQLADQLLAQLRARPWLLVLDGLERVLVAYHRADAAQLSDEAAYRPDRQPRPLRRHPPGRRRAAARAGRRHAVQAAGDHPARAQGAAQSGQPGDSRRAAQAAARPAPRGRRGAAARLRRAWRFGRHPGVSADPLRLPPAGHRRAGRTGAEPFAGARRL